jgi:flagellar basal-body rod protein FlgB
MAATNAAHLSDAAPAAPLDGTLLYRVPQQPSIDGNTVDPQVEYAQFSQNALQYQSSLTFLNNRIKNLMTAIRGD